MNIKIIGTFVATALFAGSLNVAEAEEAKKTSRSSREAIMKRFDKDGDGKLNETERKAAAAALRKQSGSESDRGRQRIETARRQISAAMKAGEITEKQGKERMAALKKRISQSQSGRESDRGSESDRGRQRIETARRQISAAMKAGEITEKQGKERMAALKKRISQSQSGSGNNRAKSDNDRSRRGSDYRARLMKEFDKNGDGKLDKAEREAARKGPSSRRGKGGGERSARGRDNRRADRTAESRTRGQGGEKAERRRRSDRRGKKD